MKFTVFLFFVCLAFATDYEMIARKVNSMNTTWKAAPVTSKRDYRQLVGVLPGGPKLPIKSYKKENVVIPEHFDLREEWPNCKSIGEIRDQANCGDCWALAAASAASDRICIATNGTSQPRLSAMNLATCCEFCMNGCHGGYTPHAWTALSYYGAVTEGEYGSDEGCVMYPLPKCNHFETSSEYPDCTATIDTPVCSRECRDSYPKSYDDDKHYFKDGYLLDTVEDMQIDIMKHGSIEVTIQVCDDFITYRSGVYQHVTGEVYGGHAVRVIGWGVENDVPYWIVMNSWNEGWGDHGTIKMLRGQDECIIEEQAVAGVPII
ncbi:hypothetical protein WA158_004813 [Blastocystis sp. Blastoise]